MSNTKNAHISFTPMTGGGSVYYAKDERVQKALEQHPKFGRLFAEDKHYKEVVVAIKAPTPKAVDVVEVRVACVDDAKDYLSDKFGVSRTKMRSIENIKSIAATKNVVFIGIDE